MATLGAAVVKELSSSLQIISDHLLAWQLQAEEYKRGNQATYQDLLPNSPTPKNQGSTLYQFQNLQGNNLSFTLKPTLGDRDCFFHAVNKPNFNRSSLITKLLENASDKAVLFIFAHEIRQFLYLGYTGNHSDKQENEACQQLLTENIKGLFFALKGAEEALTLKVSEARFELGEAETHGKLPKELLALLRQRNSNLVAGFEQAYQSILNANEAIYQYCNQESIFKRYVELYLRDAQGYIPFSRDFGREISKTTIDVINQLFQLKIQVYLPHTTNKTQLQLANQLQSGETVPIFHNGINHFWGLIVKSPSNTNSNDAHEQDSKPVVQSSKINSLLRLKEEVEHIVRQTSFEVGRDHAKKSSLKNRDVSAKLVASSKLLPKIPFDRKELQEIIDELPMATDIKVQVNNYIDNIEKHAFEIHRYQSKRKPENFYGDMKTAILSIRNITNEMYELIKFSHLSLPNTIKQLIFKWITPLETDLARHLEMPLTDKEELELKTKHLYAEQSFVARSPLIQSELMEHLGTLKKLLADSGESSPRCYISYAWPSKENKEKEYWVQPFLSLLYDHLHAAGVRVVMDIRDNKPGDSIYRFIEQYHEGNYVILVGTDSLLQKHKSIRTHAVQTELSIILGRFEQDQKQFGQSRIYPMLISGTMKTAYPEIYDKYRTVRDAREQGYLGTLRKLIDWIYESCTQKIESKYLDVWKSYYQTYQGLPKDLQVIEKEITLGYHRQHLDDLKQDIQYQSVQAQEETKHSPAVTAEMIGVLMKSQGTNPKIFYEGYAQQFQRPMANPDFIERKELWEKIERHFKQSEQQILTLTAYGLGGVGKTALAQEYYLHPPRPYILRAWFFAENKESIYQQYIELALAYGIKFAEEVSIEQKAMRVKGWLEGQKDCLLVYDNVPDAKTVAALLPEQGKHHILMTSRNEVDWSAHQKLDVDVMSEAEAIALIVKITKFHEDTEKLKKLVKILGYLPLALAQAGAYMSVKSVTAEQYLNRYKKYQVKLLSDETSRSPRHEPVWITFNMNFDALSKECPAALMTLKQASWLNNAYIPEILLEAMVDGKDTESIELLWDDIKENVRRYSLMHINIENHQLDIHPLVQDILRSQQDVAEKIFLFKQICDAMDHLIALYDRQGGMKYKTLFSHAERLHQHGQQISKLQDMLGTVISPILAVSPDHLGIIYLNMGLTTKALIFYQQQLEVYEAYYGKDHSMVFSTIANLGNAYLTSGDPESAKRYSERALKLSTQHYGSNNLTIASSLVNLGCVYGDLGDPKEQKNLLELALEIQKKYGQTRDQLFAKTLMCLGNAYGDLGDLQQQKARYEQALTIFELCCDENDIQIGSALSRIGAILVLEDSQRAKKYLDRSLNILEKHIDKNNPRIAIVHIYLGLWYGVSENNIKKAEELLIPALKTLKESYNIKHPEISRALFNLGKTYLHNASGDIKYVEKGKSLLEESLRLDERYFNTNHPILIYNLWNLECAYKTLGNLKEEKNALHRILEISNHHRIGKLLSSVLEPVLERLSKIYDNENNLSKKMTMLEQGLKAIELNFDAENLILTPVLVELGKTNNDLREAKKAKEYLERALKIYKDHGKICPEATIVLTHLSNSDKILGEFVQCYKRLENVLEMVERYRDINHLEIAEALINLGLAYLVSSKTKAAKSHFERAEKILLQHYDENHPEIFLVRSHLQTSSLIEKDSQQFFEFNKILEGVRMGSTSSKALLEAHKTYQAPSTTSLGNSKVSRPQSSDLQLSMNLNQEGVKYYKANEYDKALEYFQQALVLRQKSKATFTEETSTLEFNIGAIYLLQQNYNAALSHLQVSVELRTKLLGVNHQKTQKAQERLKQCIEGLKQTSTELEVNRAVVLDFGSNVNNTIKSNQPLIFSSFETVNDNKNNSDSSVSNDSSKTPNINNTSNPRS